MNHFFAMPGSIRALGMTFVASLAALFAASPADARVTRIQIDAARSQSPTFGGFSWPGVGQYEKIVGMAFGEVNPHDRQNRMGFPNIPSPFADIPGPFVTYTGLTEANNAALRTTGQRDGNVKEKRMLPTSLSSSRLRRPAAVFSGSGSTVISTDPNSPNFLKIDGSSNAAAAGVDVGVATDYTDASFSTPPDIGAFTP